MTLDAISAVGPMLGSDLTLGATSATEASGSMSFSTRLREELSSVNETLVGAETELQDLATGRQTNLHHVMLSLENARQSFQLLVQVRNKILDAYQELMRMQV